MCVRCYAPLGPLDSCGKMDPASIDGWDLSGRADQQVVIMAIDRDERDKSGDR